MPLPPLRLRPSFQPQLPGIRPSRMLDERGLVIPTKAKPPGISDLHGRHALDDLYQQLEIKLDRAERLLQSPAGGPADVVAAGNRAQLEVAVDSISRLLDLLGAEMQRPGSLDPGELQFLLRPGGMQRPDRALSILERPDFALEEY